MKMPAMESLATCLYLGDTKPNWFRMNSDPEPPRVSKPTGAIGVARVVIQTAQIIPQPMQFWRYPNPFVRIFVNNVSNSKISKQEQRTYQPNWFSQPQYVLVHAWSDVLRMDILDHHRFWKENLIGTAMVPFKALQSETTHTGVELPLMKHEKKTGVLLFDVFFHPTIEYERLTSESPIGICTVVLHKAKGLSCTERSSKRFAPVANISLAWNDESIHSTSPGRFDSTDVLNWESTAEFLCFDRHSTEIVVKITSGRSRLDVLGHLSIQLDDLLGSEPQERWWPLSGTSGGQLRMSSRWAPVQLDES